MFSSNDSVVKKLKKKMWGSPVNSAVAFLTVFGFDFFMSIQCNFTFMFWSVNM